LFNCDINITKQGTSSEQSTFGMIYLAMHNTSNKARTLHLWY